MICTNLNHLAEPVHIYLVYHPASLKIDALAFYMIDVLTFLCPILFVQMHGVGLLRTPMSFSLVLYKMEGRLLLLLGRIGTVRELYGASCDVDWILAWLTVHRSSYCGGLPLSIGVPRGRKRDGCVTREDAGGGEERE